MINEAKFYQYFKKNAPVFGSHALKIQQLWERLTLSHITKMNIFLQ